MKEYPDLYINTEVTEDFGQNEVRQILQLLYRSLVISTGFYSYPFYFGKRDQLFL